MSNNLMKKIYDFFCNDDDDDYDPTRGYFFNNIDKLDNSDKYPISQYKAFKIAIESENLKSDYYRNDSRNITFLDFTDCKVELSTYNNEKYWHVKITDGDVSWISYEDSNDEFNQTFCDGHFIDEDFKKLQCLININTGEYLYYPEKD